MPIHGADAVNGPGEVPFTTRKHTSRVGTKSKAFGGMGVPAPQTVDLVKREQPTAWTTITLSSSFNRPLPLGEQADSVP